MSDLKLDVDQASELKAAFRRGDWTNEEIKRLCEGDMLARVRAVILGRSEIKVLECVIVLDADPFVPKDWTVESHQKMGLWKWNLKDVELFLVSGQRDIIVGEELRKALQGKKVLNANVLDYLLAHLYLIPEEWKGKCIFFWGTIYCRADGNLYVRYLGWSGVRWVCDYRWLASEWQALNPSAVLVS